MLRVTFVEACERSAGSPPFAAEQFPHRRVRLVRGGEHAGCGRVVQGRLQESAPDSVPPSVSYDKEQVNSVALVEMPWPDGEKAHDLAVLDHYQAGLLTDQSLDVLGPAEAVRVGGSYGADVFGLRCAQLSHARKYRLPAGLAGTNADPGPVITAVDLAPGPTECRCQARWCQPPRHRPRGAGEAR